MLRLALVSVAVCLSGGVLADAQQPAAGEGRDLPIRRVVLYKSGVGFFEHVGRVTGTERITIPFTSSQLDDVLKTLTVLDLDGGAVSSVGYSSDAPLARRLGAIGLPIGDETSLSEFLSALRGARVEVRRGATLVSGRLLDVESRSRAHASGVEQVDQISLVTATGEVHAFDLGTGTVVRFADAGMNQRLNRYLETVASSRDQSRRALAIDASGTGARRIYVSYVSEVPVWKTTYRIVMPETPGGQPRLQGWAIVDNTVGDDWTDVELSLVAGAPQSFVQPISQPLYTRRPEVPMATGLLLSPQTHAAALIEGAGARGVVVDTGGAVLPGVLVRVYDQGGTLVASTVTGPDGRFSVPGAAGQLRAEATLEGFEPATRHFEAGAEARIVMNVGALTETMSIAAEQPRRRMAPRPGTPGGVVGGVVGGLPDAPPPPAAPYSAAMAVQASARDLGELFEYKLTERVTVRQNRSAMVPIVSSPLAADRVSIWSGADGSARPRRALWVTNGTGLTLDGGSVAVIDGGAFGGEGLIETVKPGERRLVSYAADLGMQVEARPEGTTGARTRIGIARGVMTTETVQCERLRYTARNQDSTARQLVIEHPRRQGWELASDSPKPAESTTSSHRFQIAVAPGATAAVVVSTLRPVRSSVQLMAVGEEALQLHLKQASLDQRARTALEAVVAAMRELNAIDQRIGAADSEASRIDADQQRVRENMKSLKGSSEERQLLSRYVRQLDQQEDRIAALRVGRAALEGERAEKTRALAATIEAIAIEPGPAGAPCQ